MSVKQVHSPTPSNRWTCAVVATFALTEHSDFTTTIATPADWIEGEAQIIRVNIPKPELNKPKPGTFKEKFGSRDFRHPNFT